MNGENPPLGMEPAARACALAGNPTATWFRGDTQPLSHTGQRESAVAGHSSVKILVPQEVSR